MPCGRSWPRSRRENGPRSRTGSRPSGNSSRTSPLHAFFRTSRNGSEKPEEIRRPTDIATPESIGGSPPKSVQTNRSGKKIRNLGTSGIIFQRSSVGKCGTSMPREKRRLSIPDRRSGSWTHPMPASWRHSSWPDRNTGRVLSSPSRKSSRTRRSVWPSGTTSGSPTRSFRKGSGKSGGKLRRERSWNGKRTRFLSDSGPLCPKNRWVSVKA